MDVATKPSQLLQRHTIDSCQDRRVGWLLEDWAVLHCHQTLNQSFVHYSYVYKSLRLPHLMPRGILKSPLCSQNIQFS